MRNRLILASGSPRRKELLEQVGAEFEILPARGEEVITSTLPEEAVKELSLQKAAEVAERYKKELPMENKDGKTIILGADTVVAFENQILGKPRDKEDAVRILQMLSGNTHSVFTGVSFIIEDNGKQVTCSFYEETKVTMYPVNESQILAYVESKEPMDKAGAYAIQGKGALFIEKIMGDYNNVVGLPVAAVFQKLGKLGIEIL